MEVSKWVIVDKKYIQTFENRDIQVVHDYLLKQNSDVHVKISLHCVLNDNGEIYEETINRFGRYIYLHKNGDIHMALTRCMRDIDSEIDNMSINKKITKNLYCITDVI